MKDIIVAKTAGFCWGVQRAFQKVMDIAKGKNGERIYTFGPLIHNSNTVRMLEEKGIKVIDSIPEKIGGVVAIRTHGICPDERKSLEEAGARLCNATCPDVAFIQGMVRWHVRRGYFVVIIGDREHPEVKGLLGFGEGNSACVIHPEDVDDLPPELEKVCVISQSTQDFAIFDKLVKLIRQRYPEAKVYDTICRSTAERQEELRRIAASADAVVVVGGRNSANTTRLAEISRKMGTKTWHVEDATELSKEDFVDAKSIGVTAGASTPSWVIEEVVEKLKSF